MSIRTLTPVRVQHRLFREEGGYAREQKLAGELIARGAHAAHSAEHVSVMGKEVLAALALKDGDIVLDATAGAGGHSEAILAHGKTQLIALDADPEAVARVAMRLKKFGTRARVIEGNFRDCESILNEAGVEQITKALFDFGWNSAQLFSGRGFSFLHDEPLIMSYGPRSASGFTAAEILNTWSEKTLADVFFGYGEERYARRIAKAVALRRKIKAFETTLELVEVLRDAVPAAYRRGRLNPATKTFQALRIAVNDELKSIELGLTSAWKALACGGRIVVLTFHSIEDRAVKRIFAALVKQHEGRLVFKKPLVPSRAEITSNARARSAKMRAIEKICNE